MPRERYRTEQQRKEEHRRMAQGRRRLLVAAGVTTSAAGLTAAYLAWRKYFPQETQGSNFPEISKFYPEVGNLNVKDTDVITTEGGVRVKWFNLSTAKFNPSGAKLIYDRLEELSRLSLNHEYPVGETKKILNWEPRDRNEQILIIVPENSPNPFWLNEIKAYPETIAATNTRFETPVTFIKAPELLSDDLSNIRNETFANGAFITEACQTGIIVKTTSAEGQETRGDLGQEIVCNSIGNLFEVRLYNNPYPAYVNLTLPLIELPNIEGQYSPIKFSQTVYESFPDVRVIETR